MAVLSMREVVGGYGDTEILHGVSMDVDAGEIVCIIGPNGAGKSTAMKAVFGLLNLTAGSIALDGQDITAMPPEQVVRHGVCYVPQTENIFPSLTVEENLEMGAFVRQDDFRPRLAEIYELFPPLAEKRKQSAGTLSGGQRQMVAMGKAMMLEPKILLLDEPSAGLSPKFRGEIFSIVKTINDAGVPILMVEQNAKQALAIADRGYVLVDGKNKFVGTGQELLDDPEVAQMFLGGASTAVASDS
ncbi:MAG: ABC transporter ATP-binding protein [Chromatiales bacterium]|jgi:branched-chain amino acid transport system ATP-binding protein|nr:ABC transporter ATP-binding protein [Chromatiales bacterium]